MINTQDQESLFKLIADYIEDNINCVAIGGTAMMFHGYKATTKDIDLVFESKKDRDVFIKAIEKLGYSLKSTTLVYSKDRLNHENKPLIYSRGEEKFDLFVKDVFGIEIEFRDIVQRHDFIGKKELIIFTIQKEYLILLKSVTNREKDYEDIETIVKIEKNIDWDFIINEAIKKKKKNEWILIDLERNMQMLKKITFIKKEFFDRIYKAEKISN